MLPAAAQHAGNQCGNVIDVDVALPVAVGLIVKEVVGAVAQHTSDNNLDTSTMGLYEGAGCVLKGVYRPCPNCMMRTLKVPVFCPVCTRTIQEIIDFYTKK